MKLQNIETHTADRRRFVLVVDSNDRNQRFLSTLLTQFEYEVHVVRTAKEALEIAAVINPVLIVAARQSDAENDALALIKSFRSVNPTCTAPFIVLTTKPDPAFERDCLRAGALSCLRAPVTFENFYRVIQVAIEPIPRMTIRISTNLPAAINGTRKDEWVQDISEDGAYILTSALHRRDTKLSVQIKLPACVISADAVVLYSNQPNNDRNIRSGMGLRFLQISEEDRQRIRLFIRGEMSKGISPLRPAP
jgi:CheY-like chemotaxis protein